MKKADTVTAVGFLLFIAAMLVLALFRLPEMAAELRAGWAEEGAPDATVLDKAAYCAASGEAALNKQLDADHLFIQLYGGFQRLTGRRYVADAAAAGSSVMKLDTGALTFLDLASALSGAPSGAEVNAGRAVELARSLGDTPFLAVAAPVKVAGEGDLPAGVPDRANPAADAFLSALEAAGVPALDLRPAFDARADRSELFFRTDHHWKPQGAFFAYQLLARELEARFGFASSPRCTDPASYDWSLLPGFFLGSQGKRVGSLYAGTDDFPVVSPKFPTDFTYTTPYEVRTGPFGQSLCFPQFIGGRDWFGGNPYAYYSGGDYGEAVMVNHLNPDGPKVLLIRESFSCALAPFLAQSCSTLTTVDMRALDRPLSDVVADADPDLVLLLYSASTFSNAAMFDW